MNTRWSQSRWLGGGILVICLGVAYAIYRSPPSLSSQTEPTAPSVSVDALQVRRRDFPITLTSYGRTYPKTQIELAAQVGGQIQWVSDQFRRGGRFDQDDLLIQLDQRDFQAEVKVAQASLVAAQQRLIEEQALAETALRNWEKHKTQSSQAAQAVSALTLRQPQLKTAQANVQSAEANLQKAQLALERAHIKAPFAGRVEEIFAGLGQMITPNRALARIHSADALEIRLPIAHNDWRWMARPYSALTVYFTTAESPYGRDVSQKKTALSRSKAIASPVWAGNIVGADSMVDSASQQRHAIAEISLSARQPDLVVGQYLQATLHGNRLQDAIVIPSHAIQQGVFVYKIVNQRLQRTNVRLGWQNAQHTHILEGLQAGDTIVVSPIGYVQSGIKASIRTQYDQTTASFEPTGVIP